MLPVILMIAPKEGTTPADVFPVMPTADELCAYLTEVLAKMTARNQLIGWTVTEVTTE